MCKWRTIDFCCRRRISFRNATILYREYNGRKIKTVAVISHNDKNRFMLESMASKRENLFPTWFYEYFSRLPISFFDSIRIAADYYVSHLGFPSRPEKVWKRFSRLVTLSIHLSSSKSAIDMNCSFGFAHSLALDHYHPNSLDQWTIIRWLIQ